MDYFDIPQEIKDAAWKAGRAAKADFHANLPVLAYTDFPCSTCGAAIGEPCNVRRKTWYRQTEHRARQNRYGDAFNARRREGSDLEDRVYDAVVRKLTTPPAADRPDGNREES